MILVSYHTKQKGLAMFGLSNELSRKLQCLWALTSPHLAAQEPSSVHCAAGHWTHCIVSPQLWMGIYHIQMGSLTLGWWCHSIYVTWSSTIYGILTLMHHYFLRLFNLLLSKLTTHWPHHWLISTKLSWHPDVSWPQVNMWSLSLWREDVKWGGK